LALSSIRLGVMGLAVLRGYIPAPVAWGIVINTWHTGGNNSCCSLPSLLPGLYEKLEGESMILTIDVGNTNLVFGI
jgi:hypothetical protein